MYLNDLWISDEAVDLVTGSGPTLDLRLAWRWDELPLLLDLPSQLTLRWDHICEDDPDAGVPVRLVTWSAAHVNAPLVWVTLRLERAVQGTPSAGDPMTLAPELEPHGGCSAAGSPCRSPDVGKPMSPPVVAGSP